MINFILSLFSPFRRFIETMGADYNQFISILKLKLTQDDRRVTGLTKTKDQNHVKMLVKQSFSQIFMGLIFIIILGTIKSPFTYFYFAHLLVMILMAMMIVSEFTTILFDTSENTIIQPLPIKGNTIGLARSAHVFIYLTMMAFNLSVPSFIVAIFKFGIGSALAFVFTIFPNVLFTLFLSNILYLVIMRIASGERLKSILMYFQIIVAILFMAGYQLGVNMIDRSVITNMVLPVHWYTFFIPPAFFSGFIEAISTQNFDLQHFIFITEALIVPAIAIYLTGKYLTPVFNQKLMDLEQGDRTSKVKAENTRENLWFRTMESLFVYSAEEKAAFKLMWKMTGRERILKQTLLPSIGYILFMIVVPIFSKGFSFSTLVESDKFLLVLYVFIIVAVTLPGALLTGNNQHETWIFKSIPLSTPAIFFKGSIKAAFVRFFIPLYLMVGTVVCSIWGIRVLPDVLIALQVIYLFTILHYYLQHLGFPFSMEKVTLQGSTSLLKFLIITIPTVALGFFHWFLLHHWFSFANLMLIPLYAGAILYVNRIFVYKKITWQKVDQMNSYS
ncbi:MAG: hypothetical protein A2W90_01350 [Bacteroidetes bacterium GWF2_42_66]|nr:MAG: hypothetical protein A2W92_00770 [Bacteroidetes bacterium GWA2_42_15]OFY01021.1 MAG: hypothetical protein A2W89_14840 [Bacteroidetes bacterium GWE2_42_39]OFY41862.1 MAG: hypothetical protein A2W90_01350 [Bacteroidetes bacterium GWF2_42_66]HBL77962.1 hypothetical protein [Prolixibacteraceae bacterium]HCR90183.1 hypothetical protein [Prolixibacteraceae bacterium]